MGTMLDKLPPALLVGLVVLGGGWPLSPYPFYGWICEYDDWDNARQAPSSSALPSSICDHPCILWALAFLKMGRWITWIVAELVVQTPSVAVGFFPSVWWSPPPSELCWN
jgi:hypothetical protein